MRTYTIYMIDRMGGEWYKISLPYVKPHVFIYIIHMYTHGSGLKENKENSFKYVIKVHEKLSQTG